MGNKDNPRRQLRNKIIAGGIGVLLLASSGDYMYDQYRTIEKQDKIIHEYQRQLVEQGSLIDRQKKESSNQKTQIKNLETKIQELDSKTEDLTNKLEAKNIEEETYKKEISELKAAQMPSRGQETGGRAIMVEATGYIAMCSEGCTGITATGMNLRDNPNAKVIAVDPDVIPLGTKVFVPGYGYAVAADTGGGINNYEIDIHFPTTEAARQWGRRTVEIRILD